MWKLLSWAKQLPMLAYAIAAGGALVVSAYLWHQHAVRDAYTAGRQDMIARARTTAIADSLRALRADTVTQERVAKTDSVRTVIRWRVASVDSQAIIAAALAQQLPPSLDTIPQVVALKAFVLTLAASVRTVSADYAKLDSAITAERAAHQLQLGLVQSQLAATRVIGVALADSVTHLSKRPRWRTVATVGATTLGVGLGIGRYLLTRGR